MLGVFFDYLNIIEKNKQTEYSTVPPDPVCKKFYNLKP